jgi:hypothetical protein
MALIDGTWDGNIVLQSPVRAQESRGDQPVSGIGNCYLINNVTAKPKRIVPKSVFWQHSAIVARLKSKSKFGDDILKRRG